jgi:hypothetical protein
MSTSVRFETSTSVRFGMSTAVGAALRVVERARAGVPLLRQLHEVHEKVFATSSKCAALWRS